MAPDEYAADGKVGQEWETLERLRTRLCSLVLWAMVPLGGLVGISGIYQELRTSRKPAIIITYLFVMAVVLAAATLQRIPYKIRALVFCLALYGVAASELWFFGLTTVTCVYLYAFVIFAGILCGLEIGLGAFLLSVVSLLLMGWLFMSGFWLYPSRVNYPFFEALIPWLTAGLSFVALSATALILNAVLLRTLDRNSRSARKLVEELKTEVEARQRAEQEIREKEQWFRSLLENASDAIVLTDASGKLTYASPGVARILGHPADTNIGRSVFDLVHPDDVQAARAAIAGALQRDSSKPQTLEFRLRHDNGSWRVVEARGRLLTGRDGERHVIINYRDVTDRHAAEKERARLEQQLQQAQKMEATGRLAGGIAHDFNNLLQVILGHLGLVEKDRLDPQLKNSCEEIQHAAERAADLTSQLLAFSRRQVAQPADLNLNDLIQDMLKMISRLLGENIELKFAAGAELGTVCIDKGQFEQVLMNLCVNGMDAMPNGGSLGIKTQNVILDAEFCRRNHGVAEGPHVLMSVSDTGVGMDDTTLSRAFEPFFTTKEVGHGTGLGLATVYGIVKQHNGLVLVDSQTGHGTTFRVYFPAVERQAQQIGQAERQPAAGGRETILVAEDDPMVRRLVERILHHGGYTVLSASDGAQAVDLFRENAERIDLVLCDVIMPKLGGREVMEQIAPDHPNVRFLFSSGYSKDALHNNFILKDGLRLVNKPYKPDELLREVRQVLDS